MFQTTNQFSNSLLHRLSTDPIDRCKRLPSAGAAKRRGIDAIAVAGGADLGVEMRPRARRNAEKSWENMVGDNYVYIIYIYTHTYININIYIYI